MANNIAINKFNNMQAVSFTNFGNGNVFPSTLTKKAEPDSYVSSDTNKKNGMSMTSKILIGLGVIGAAALSIYYIRKGKAKNLVPKKQAPLPSPAPQPHPVNPNPEVIKPAGQVLSSEADIAKQFKIGKYKTFSELNELNGIRYLGNQPYTGKVIEHNRLTGQYYVYKYKDGHMVSEHIIHQSPSSKKITIDSRIERKDKCVSIGHELKDGGKLKVTDKTQASAINDSYKNPNAITAKSALVELPQHSYSDVPQIAVVTRGNLEDFSTYRLSTAAIDPRTLSSKIKMQPNSMEPVLAIGKTADGKRVVYLRAAADRVDEVGRPVRNMFTLTSGNDKFNQAQLDLITAVTQSGGNNSPLAGAISVRPSIINETINIDQNRLLNEIAHSAKGITMPETAKSALSQLETMAPDSFIRIV